MTISGFAVRKPSEAPQQLLALQLALCLSPLVGSAAAAPADGAAPERAAAALVERVLPGRSGGFLFEALPSAPGGDVFEVDSRDGMVVLRGNNGVALASEGFGDAHRAALPSVK